MALPADLIGKERDAYTKFTDEERAGYLIYRQEQIDENASVQRWRIKNRWAKLSDTERQAFVERVAIGASSGEAAGDGPDEPEAREELEVADATIRDKPAEDDPDAPSAASSKEERVVDDYLTTEIAGAKPRSRALALGWHWQWAGTLYDGKTNNDRLRTWVYLSVLVDENNAIRRRMVCKKARWDNVRANLLAGEATVSETLSFCPHTMRIDYVQRPEDVSSEIIRLYSEYLPHGDLDSVLDIYFQESHRDKQIPEAFIWYVFFSVACGIYALNTGYCATDLHKKAQTRAGKRKAGTADTPNPVDGQIAKGWHKRVHMDIKPGNIFLGLPTSPQTAYPKPLLADFDTVDYQCERLDADPHRAGKGTPPYRAPELQCTHLHNHPISGKADIWSLGMVVWKCMHTSLSYDRCTEIRKDNIAASFHFSSGSTIPNKPIPGCDSMYSKQLHDLVEHCLQVNPDDRIGIAELWNRAKEGLERCQRVMGGSDEGEPPEHLRLSFKEDDGFLIGSEFVKPPKKKRKVRTREEHKGGAATASGM